MPRPTPFSRRSALALPPTLLLALTAGCDDTSAGPEEPTRRDPDEALLASVVAATQELHATLATSASDVGTPAVVVALSQCLVAHLDVFAPDAQPSSPADATNEPGAVGNEDPADARPGTAAGTQELTLGHTHLTLLSDASARAESGAFARVLACAAAGIAQHLVPLEKAQTKDSA